MGTSEGVGELEGLVDSIGSRPDSDLLLLLLIGPCDATKYTQLVPFLSKRHKRLSGTFVCLLDTRLAESPRERLALADVGVNMVSSSVDQSAECVVQVLSYLLTRQRPQALLACPECGLGRLGEDDLWKHFPLYHVINPNMSGKCPMCLKHQKNIAVHLHDHHGPPKRGEAVADSLIPAIQFDGFAFSIVRRSDHKFLVVQEFLGQGYWYPAGRVDRHETFQEAAIREAKEEAGVDIELTGILAIHHFPTYRHNMGPRMEVCMYFVARMLDESQELKTIPDYESAGACWVTVDELSLLRLRNSDILPHIRQVESGKPILPLSALHVMNLT